MVRSARSYLDDHGKHKCSEAMRRLANTSTNIANAERAVESVLPLTNMVKLIGMEDERSTIQMVLPPFDTFHWLRKTCPLKFKLHFGAQDEGVQSWWQSFRNSTKGKQMWRCHPWLRGKSPRDLACHLPLMIFDDAGPISKTSSSFVRCFYSILGIGSEKETRILIGTGLKEGRPEDDKSWPMILNQFRQLAEPVPEGSWGGILLFVGADMEYMCNVLGMQHFNNNQCCAYCAANDSDIPHNDFSDAAEWRSTMKDNAAFCAAFRRPLHPVV